MGRIFSFDVFDTCLCRLCGDPHLVYDVLSLKIQQNLGTCWSETMRQMFVAARAESGGRSLDEIYNNMACRFPLPYSPQKMVELELKTEQQMLLPIVDTRKLVDRLRKKGSILFISDMYLPSNFIRERLTEYGFFKDGDQIFVSDELGAWKRDGSLYRLVRKQTGSSWRMWHHYGDNRYSDFLIPRRLGIHAHYLYYGYLPYEGKWYSSPTVQYPHQSILAGVARAMRLSNNGPDDQKAFVCDISAPLMTAWVVSILEDCLRNRTKKIFFCARDTHSEYIIAKALSGIDAKYSQLDIHYLLVSTKSISDTLCLDFFIQEGLASKEDDVAIVDSRGRSYFINNVNNLLIQNGYRKAKPYMLQLCPSHCDDQTMVACANETTIVHNILYSQSTSNRATAIRDIGWLFENILSLNHNGKTIGYNDIDGRIVPVFTTDKPEIVANDIENLKKQQDDILSKYAQSCLACGLATAHNILDTVIVPTLTDFSTTPRKEYLSYLTRVSIYGKRCTYVHNTFRYLTEKGGRWQKGCIFYTFPRPIAIVASKIYDKLAKNK